jgi:hypothetical protein
VLVGFAVQALALLVLSAAAAPASAVVFALCFRAARGLIVLLRAGPARRLLRTRIYGTIAGISDFVIGTTQAVSPLLAGLVYDRQLRPRHVAIRRRWSSGCRLGGGALPAHRERPGPWR